MSIAEPNYTEGLKTIDVSGITVHYDTNIPNEELTVILEVINFKEILTIKEYSELLRR
ncbi:MAG: hypothetical protein QMB63_02370 [Clostridiaceae bacterium]